jgi:hypothetical protein
MYLMTRAQFAKAVQCSKPSISAAVDKGKLDVVGLGRNLKIDVDGEKTLQYIKQQEQNGKKICEVRTDTKQTTTRKQNSSADMVVNKFQLQCNKLKKETERIEIITQEKRHDLVSRENVAMIFKKLHDIDQKELLQLPAKISPEIQALTGSDNPKIQIEIELIM